MRLLLTALALSVTGALFAAPAYAGGIGLLGTGGLHGDRVYGYSETSSGSFRQEAPELQMNANYGGGIELVLGDRDYKISGLMRAWYSADAPQTPPKVGDVFAVRRTTRNVGAISAGVQWGILGDPSRLQLTVVSLIGAGILTDDFTEYGTLDVGVGGTWNVERRVQVFADVTGGIRYRKLVSPTASGTAGVRYLFD